MFFTILRIFRFELKSKEQISDELKQQKRYLENLIGHAPEGIVWADKGSNIKYVNQKFTEIFGYSLAEARGQNIDGLLNKPHDLSEAQEITRIVSTGTTHESVGVRIRKDGTPIHVSIVGSPMTSMQGELEVFGIYRDISREIKDKQQLVESEKSLRALSDQLIMANNFKELLLDIITHDLRNPSGVIAGALELLEVEFPDHDLIEIVRNSSDNLTQVIEDASTLSRLSIGESISMENLDLVPIITQVAESFSSQLTSNGMVLKIDLPESIILRSNRIFGEVISNYISNGIKYAATGKQLFLTASVEAEFVEIEVRDNGETIPEDKRDSIFERNVQLLNGPRRGSGLGLAIVKRIALAHTATVGVKPNTPQGNIFYFRFDLSGKTDSVDS